MLTTSSTPLDTGPTHAAHPRPDRRRARWQPLDGEWEFALDGADEGLDRGWSSGCAFPLRIQVPFTFETPASGLGLGDVVHEWVWYRRTVRVDPSWRADGGRVLLHFGGVDWQAQVWVNGILAASHSGAYAPFSCDVTPFLEPDAEQELVVRAYDPASPHNGGHQPRGKQRGSWRIWYTRTTGIWGPVWLEHVGAAWMRAPAVRPEGLTGRCRVLTDVVGDAEGVLVSAEVLLEGKPVARVEGQGDLTLQVPSPRAWSPESPVLYDVVLRLHREGRLLDEVRTTTGFRTVEVRDGAVLVNGRPRFLRGVLDQGYWPDSGATPPSQDALRRDVELARSLGFDLVRKHAKVEDPHWYDWCDRTGVLVAQDMPSSQDLSTPEARAAFRQEWLEVLEALAGHPSVVLWVLFNEDWGRPGRAFQEEMVALTRERDPSRLVVDASGWVQWYDTDLLDVHDYTSRPGELVRDPHGGRARWVGEFGGVKHQADGGQGWGYSTAGSPQELVGTLAGLVAQLDDPTRLAGFVYTQLTDVESEVNGLLTAGRRCKAAAQDVARAVRGQDGAVP